MAIQERRNAPILDPEHRMLYVERMEAGVTEKLGDIMPGLRPVIENFPSPVIVSVGAGSGKLEEGIARTIPHASVLALDYSACMAQSIWEKANGEGNARGLPSMDALTARAEALPFADARVHAIIASSMVHHPASFEDGGQLGSAVRSFFADAARVLVPGGRLIIRDFMQPSDPDEPLVLRIGRKRHSEDADPALFLLGFANRFPYGSMRELQHAITRESIHRGSVRPGAEFPVPAWLAMELAAHYSWAVPRFSEEILERYAYLPVDQYGNFVQRTFTASGFSARIVSASARILPGYPDHVDGGLDFFRKTGEPVACPVYTGVVVAQKIR